MAVSVFTRFFEGKGTVLLKSATPIFDSGKVPGHGDIIYAKNGSVLQVQLIGQKLREVLIREPERRIALRPSWELGPIQKLK